MEINSSSKSPIPPIKLTVSQERAYADLQFFLEMHRRGVRRVGGIETRPCPLIIAPSGAGKTFFINRLAEENELPLYSLNVQNWIVRGAKNDGQLTLAQIAEFVRSNGNGGIIFVDEVNKLSRACPKRGQNGDGEDFAGIRRGSKGAEGGFLATRRAGEQIGAIFGRGRPGRTALVVGFAAWSQVSDARVIQGIRATTQRL